ncbi:dienelactone hydrolase family protein [Lentzea sp. NBRC 105346]|uniref:dienelactone hydrolase family protein n=1 Tax=Lentzea sp. NBRC 105346 TaxID=3032205 RepID=UPI002557B5C7|nr:dienelactone hydrolase family protein [Lentzea sp. NBRC 105346]
MLPSGTDAVLERPAEPVAGLVLLTGESALRPLFDELCARIAAEWNVTVCAPADESLTSIEQAADAVGCARQLVVGFGRDRTYLAAADGRFDRLVSFYGPVSPEAVAALNGNGHRVLALVGMRDPLIRPADIVTLDRRGVTVVRYYEAEHGFVHDPERPAHRPADAANAWKRARDWLEV